MLKKILFCIGTSFTFQMQAQDIKPITSIGEANDLINKLKKNTLPQLRDIHQCYVDAKAIVDDYRGTKLLWVGKNKTQELPLLINSSSDSSSPGFDLNIYRNFDGLGVYQKQFFAELQTFIRTYRLEPASTLEGLQSQILKIDQGRLALSERFYEIAKKDSLYLGLLAKMKVVAEQEHFRITSEVQLMLAENCKNANLEPVAAFIDADVRNVVSNIETLRSFVLDSIDKRNLIVARTYQEIRQKYVDAYQLMAGEQLGKIGAAATDVLNLAQVGESMLKWWISANVNGLAQSLHLKYLQFEVPRDLLLVEKQRAANFDRRLRSYSQAPAEMSAYYLTRLAQFQKTIDENIKTLNDRGWKGQMDRQVLLNTKRKALADRLTPACLESIRTHLGASQKTYDPEAFRNVERLYAISIDTCAL